MRSLCRTMAAPWPGLQFANGTFPDYLHHHEAPASTRYAEAMLGYGMLMTGAREGDDALIDAGLHGVTWFVGQADLQRDHPSVFANAAVASAYSVFFVADGDEHPTVGPRSAADARQRVTFTPDAEVAFDAAGCASGRDAALARANLLFGASDGGPVHIVVKPA